VLQLGVQKAFGRDADFSGIAGDKGDLFISEIIQKTFIDVDEAGVEAAAATFLSIRAASLVPHKKQFIADHPFLFYIQVKKVVLFVGKVTNPQH
jgi:serpin B